MPQDGSRRVISSESEHEGDNENPGTTEGGNYVGNALAEGFFLVNHDVGVARRAPEDGEHVHAGMRFALE